jgi:predicted glutamine amidotransferase
MAKSQIFNRLSIDPIRESLSDSTYRLIKGTTDSEHIFALLVEIWQSSPNNTLFSALRATLQKLTELASEHDTSFSANVIVSDGQAVAATRYAYRTEAPTLYWLSDAQKHPNQVIIASEPLSVKQNWTAFGEQSMLFVQAQSLQPTISLLERLAPIGV